MSDSVEYQSVAVSPAAGTGFWRAVREAILGTQQDFTEGSIGRAITILAVPMVLEMIMESLFGVVDVFFVARLGADAVATIGLTESILTLIFAVAMGLSMATTAFVARRIGEKDPAGAAVGAVQAILVGLLLSAALGVVCWLYAPQILRLMGASAGVVQTGSRFTAVLLGGTATVVLLFLINAVFRGAGDAAVAMRALWLANIINIILEPCFIFGWGPFPQMGLTGAAVGTTIGRGAGVVYQLAVLLSGRTRVVIHRQQVRVNWEVLRRLIRVSLPGILQFLISMSSWLGLVRILALFGSTALAGYTIALRVIIFAILPAWGMSNAAATLVGQNLGAGKPDRAERSVWVTAFYNMLFLGGVAVGFILFAEPLIRLFTADPAVVPVGVDCLRFISYGYVFYAYGMVMVQAFNGAGDTVTPMRINLFCYWLWELPLAYVLAQWAHLGTHGVFVAITIAESTIAVVGVLAFRRGKWKQKAI